MSLPDFWTIKSRKSPFSQTSGVNFRCLREAWIEDHDWFANTFFSSVAVFLGVGDFSRMVVGPDIKSQFPFFHVFLSLLFWQVNTKSTSGGISLFFPAIFGKFSFILNHEAFPQQMFIGFSLDLSPKKLWCVFIEGNLVLNMETMRQCTCMVILSDLLLKMHCLDFNIDS